MSRGVFLVDGFLADVSYCLSLVFWLMSERNHVQRSVFFVDGFLADVSYCLSLVFWLMSHTVCRWFPG